jgi:hypothetical protein
MTDTPPYIEKLHREMLLRRSGPERLAMGCRMFDAARHLMRASLGDPEGRDNSPEMRVRLFLRTYAQDFDPQTRDRIVAWLRAGGQRPAAEPAPGINPRAE